MGLKKAVSAEIDEALLEKILEDTGASSLSEAVEKLLLNESHNEGEIKKLLGNLKTTNTVSITWTREGAIGVTSLRPVVGEDSRTLIKILNNLIGQLLADPEDLEKIKEFMQDRE